MLRRRSSDMRKAAPTGCNPRRTIAFLPASIRLPIESALSRLRAFTTNDSGNVVIMTALAMPVLIGVTGLGVEVSYWYVTQRSMQNAADSAAVAAATNGTANYTSEAKAVAARYGYVDGVKNISVVISNTVTCPSGGATCYSATVTGYVPLFLSQVVGYRGAKTIGGTPQTQLNARAVARIKPLPREYCLLALGTGGVEIRTNGAPKADLSGCNIMSNGDARCNGHNLGADYGDAAGNNDGCGVNQRSGVSPVADPYANLASNIPPDPCKGAYPQEPAKKKDPPLPSTNLWTGTKKLQHNEYVCGDLQLTGNVTLNTPSDGTVLVIWNGQLDTNGFTFATSSGSGITVVFAGTSGAYTHAPTGGGTLDIAAPTTGPWAGVAIYQAPNLTTGVNISAAGNSPTWKITGLVYLPNSSVTFSGAVNKSSNGHSCFALVVHDILINGTGSIFAKGDCAEAGLRMPTGSGTVGRGELVL